MESVSAFPSRSRSDTAPSGALSRGRGWFSIALGLTEIAMPRLFSRWIGLEPRARTSWILRAVGVRELAAGVSLLAMPHRPEPLWSRVIGDAMDLALLGMGARSRRRHAMRLAGALTAVASATALDVLAARRTQRVYTEANKPVIFSTTINKPPAEVYAFFRRLSQLPRVMDYLESVREADSTFSHWVAKLPLGERIAWDVKIVEDRRGELIAWRSVQGSLVDITGRATFTRTLGRDTTDVRVEMKLDFGTRSSASVARFFTRSQLEGDLRRLKQVLEAGDVGIAQPRHELANSKTELHRKNDGTLLRHPA
jgi:uncharacterized membrane protein